MPKRVERDAGHVGAQHVERAVGEVDDAEQAEDHRQARLSIA